ncbi:MAG: HK97 gp10 family phage protein [Rhodoglobus sp.]
MTDLSALIRKAAAAALNAQAEVAQRASRDLAPKESMALSRSIEVTDATSSSLVSQVYSNAEHALYQHEALDLRHPNGQAKFMEAAVAAEHAAIQAAGAAAAKRALS